MEKTYLILKDSSGILRPKAGVWNNDKYDRETAEKTASRNDDEVVEVTITEVAGE